MTDKETTVYIETVNDEPFQYNVDVVGGPAEIETVKPISGDNKEGFTPYDQLMVGNFLNEKYEDLGEDMEDASFRLVLDGEELDEDLSARYKA